MFSSDAMSMVSLVAERTPRDGCASKFDSSNGKHLKGAWAKSVEGGRRAFVLMCRMRRIASQSRFVAEDADRTSSTNLRPMTLPNLVQEHIFPVQCSSP